MTSRRFAPISATTFKTYAFHIPSSSNRPSCESLHCPQGRAYDIDIIQAIMGAVIEKGPQTLTSPRTALNNRTRPPPRPLFR
jgi:hypothetical protein